MSEKDIQKSIVDYIHTIGGWAERVQAGAIPTPTGGFIRMARRGTPDILACISGKFIAIEVKINQKVIRHWEKNVDPTAQAQHHEQELIRRAGGITIVTASIDDLAVDLLELGLANQTAIAV